MHLVLGFKGGPFCSEALIGEGCLCPFRRSTSECDTIKKTTTDNLTQELQQEGI